jgi:predicted anti-sigma-YlaC factor YlaD
MTEEPDSPFMLELLAKATHLRECPECRKFLVQFAKPMARIARKVTEAELGRPMTSEETDIFARSVLAQASFTLAAQAMLSNAVSKEHPVNAKASPGFPLYNWKKETPEA